MKLDEKDSTSTLLNSKEENKNQNGDIVVVRHSDNIESEEIQYLIDTKTRKPMRFGSIDQAKEYLVDMGYCEETIDQYHYLDADEVYLKNNYFNDPDKELITVKDLM